MNKNLPLLLIIASSILIAINILFSEEKEWGFWLRILSSILVIIAMIFTLKEKNSGS